ncbi:unnamed protein product, partial [Heterosigma akashiwo]
MVGTSMPAAASVPVASSAAKEFIEEAIAVLDGTTSGSYFDSFGGSAAPMKDSTLKAEVSDTKTTGASGSYFDSMAGTSMPAATATPAAAVEAVPAPVVIPAVATAATASPVPVEPTSTGGSYFDSFGGSAAP